MAIKTIPNDIIAEQSVLGAMFLSPLAIEKATDKLFAKSFYLEKHNIIFQSIIDLHDRKVPIDVTTVTAELNKNNKLNDIGGVEYLVELTNLVPSAVNVEHYIQIVEDNYMLRSVIDTSTEIATLAYDHNGEVADILDQVESKIVGIIRNSRSS